MVPVLVIISLIVAAIGVVGLSPATAGVGLIAGACLFAILARIAQAHQHHATWPHVREQATHDQKTAEEYLEAQRRLK